MNSAWVDLLDQLTTRFQFMCAPRGESIREILSKQFVVDMGFPILTVNQRKLGYKFLCAEAAWIMVGDNRVETIAPYSKDIAKFSDDGVYFHGAYGPKIVDQLSYIVDALMADKDTRQAVLNIWREKPRGTKDCPCTISVQWFIREGVLYCVDTMRSSDAWLGIPYDVFNFSMLSAYVCLLLRERGMTSPPLLGKLYMNLGSSHLYDRNYQAARDIVYGWDGWQHKRLDPYVFHGARDLSIWLWRIANSSHPKFHLEKGFCPLDNMLLPDC